MPPKHLSRVTRHVSCTSTLRVFVSRPSCVMHHRDYWLTGTMIGGDYAAD